MKKDAVAPATIDEYIAQAPEDVRPVLESVRRTIAKAAPAAEEKIAYGIPTFTLNGNLVHFGAFKNHIGFYPAPIGMEKFAKQLSRYASGKGSAQFPLDQPMPLKLITDIVKFRVTNNVGKNKKRGKA